MSGRTQGEMNDRNPAANAAKSVTLSDMLYCREPAYSVSVVTGSPLNQDVGAGLPANLTGGRSWNMKSHFHRSDGFDACSQCFAETGRANARFARPVYRSTPASAASRSPRTAALLV